MKRKLLLVFCIIIILLILENQIWGLDNKPKVPPYDKIKNIKIVELDPEIMDYEEYVNKDHEDQGKYSGLWSTIKQIHLNSFKINVAASSTLKNHNITNLIDKKIYTAWVEGVEGDGVGEWFSIKLDAEVYSPTTTPFSVGQFCVIPGYAKNQKTWEENNRLKTALLIIYSPNAPFSEYAACRLKFQDIEKLQVFRLPHDLMAPNQDPMTKTVWLVIEEVYKGTKYSDTCISEVVLQGGCSS